MSIMESLFGEAADNQFLQNLHVLPVFLDIAMVICCFNLLCYLYRVVKGPALADRAVAMDSCGVTVMSLIVIYSIRQGTNLYMSCALVIAILGFIGMVGLSKYIQSGNIVDTGNIVLNLEEAESLKDKENAEAGEELQRKAEEARQKTAENIVDVVKWQQNQQDRDNN